MGCGHTNGGGGGGECYPMWSYMNFSHLGGLPGSLMLLGGFWAPELRWALTSQGESLTSHSSNLFPGSEKREAVMRAAVSFSKWTELPQGCDTGKHGETVANCYLQFSFHISAKRPSVKTTFSLSSLKKTNGGLWALGGCFPDLVSNSVNVRGAREEEGNIQEKCVFSSLIFLIVQDYKNSLFSY